MSCTYFILVLEMPEQRVGKGKGDTMFGGLINAAEKEDKDIMEIIEDWAEETEERQEKSKDIKE